MEEVNTAELKFLNVVGRGAFGTVKRAIWRNIDVAVKIIETANERQAFVTELKQLSRVSHPNIVRLFGANSKPPMVCLVMEYAEGGSLYDVLHGNKPKIEFTLSHAVSWLSQCALGVEYLHAMKPRALIHRDLKPPNLLLMNGGCVIKICDFGTACDAHTHMTNNKGSAAWMAPEVFEGNNYSEKCDVFSWGIIMWEVFTRIKPFEDIGGNAFRIMWAVHGGTRPQSILGCPKPFDNLMKKCWTHHAVERPSMAEVVRVMKVLSKGIKLPIKPLAHSFGEQQKLQQKQIDSVSNLIQPSNIVEDSETSQGVKIVMGHKRTGSHGSAIKTNVATAVSESQESFQKSHRRAGSYGSGDYALIAQAPMIHHIQTEPKNLSFLSGNNNLNENKLQEPVKNIPAKNSCNLNENGFLNIPNYARNPLSNESMLYCEFDENLLQPLEPCPSNEESLKLYREHRQLAEEYRCIQNDITSLVQMKHDLQLQLKHNELEEIENTKYITEYAELLSENESLKLLYQNLKQQISNLEQNRSHCP